MTGSGSFRMQNCNFSGALGQGLVFPEHAAIDR